MKSFKFSHTHQFSEAEYVSIQSTFRGKTRPLRIAFVVVFGVGLLFWPYTVVVGIALLALVAITLFMPRVIPGTAARNYAKRKFLHEPLTYTVSESELSIRGSGIDLRCSWENLAVWREIGSWLVLCPQGMQELYFPLKALRQAEVYESVIGCSRRNGVEYNSPEARAA